MSLLVAKIFSLHYFPVCAASVAGVTMLAMGMTWRLPALIVAAGAFTSGVVFWLEPLLHLSSRGGKYHSAVCEVEADVAAKMPPITLFYPTSTAPPRKGTNWLPFSDGRYLVGMAKYVHIPSFLLTDLCFTRAAMSEAASAGSAMPEPIPLFDDKGMPRPLLLFSHGLAGFPRLYTTLMMDLTARGMIVVAPTHMDQSAAFCRDATNDFACVLNTKIGWETTDREPQLLHRLGEMKSVLAKLETGDLLCKMGYSPSAATAYLATSPPLFLVGHSFGGATALLAALHCSNDAATMPGVAARLKGVISYDPWPIPLRGRLFKEVIQQGAVRFTTPSLMIMSEGWVRDSDFMAFFDEMDDVVHHKQQFTEQERAALAEVEKKTSRVKQSWYATVRYPGTGHLTCTDMSLLSPVVFRSSYMTLPPRAGILDYAADTVRFAMNLAKPYQERLKPEDDPVLAPFVIKK